MTEAEKLDEDLEDDGSYDPTAALLRQALGNAPAPSRSFLPGVQKKIRIRTRGRYFRDRWSTSRNPVSMILMATLLLLILSAALFLVIQPLVDAPVESELLSPGVDPFAADAK